MSVGNIFGIVVLIFAGIMLFCLGVIWLEKRFPSKEFDERQQRARGKAGQLGLITGVIYFLVTMGILVGQVDGEKKIEPYLLVFFGLILELMVMSTYGLLTHSYLSFLQKPISAIICFTVTGVIDLLFFMKSPDMFGGLSLVGHGTMGWVSLLGGSCFVYLAVVLLIQHLFREKE